ncbi:MAG: hypothetical protein PHV62_03570 [Sulfuricurvum sp.]|nr:hypothetical protein [Sulfuricurvum sp.]
MTFWEALDKSVMGGTIYDVIRDPKLLITFKDHTAFLDDIPDEFIVQESANIMWHVIDFQVYKSEHNRYRIRAGSNAKQINQDLETVKKFFELMETYQTHQSFNDKWKIPFQERQFGKNIYIDEIYNSLNIARLIQNDLENMSKTFNDGELKILQKETYYTTAKKSTIQNLIKATLKKHSLTIDQQDLRNFIARI